MAQLSRHNNDEPEVSAVEAARRLQVGLDYLYSLLWTGKLPGRKVGKTWRVPVAGITERLKTLDRCEARTLRNPRAQNLAQRKRQAMDEESTDPLESRD